VADEWPRRYHPARPDADGDGLEVDTSVTVEGFQLQPGTWDSLTAWCGGVRVLDADGNQAVAVNGSLAEENVARLGDYVMRIGTALEVSRADGHYQRWQQSED
jgi:hypothetical protein